ncbi:hypothetical protein GCM10009841_05990 [Microlunatus panaciterrae]
MLKTATGLPRDREGDEIAHKFTTLFTKVDTEIADVIEADIKRNACCTRVKRPRIVENSSQMIAPPRERYLPLGETDHPAIVELIRDRLHPAPLSM